MLHKTAFAAIAALAFALPAPAVAADPEISIISIYHVAPGQQVNFLKWMNQQDRISAAAGVSRSQLYAHVDGDSWDYLVINPDTTPAQEEAIGAASRKMGENPLRGGIEMRKFITSHTDTFARGPMTAGDYLTMLGEK